MKKMLVVVLGLVVTLALVLPVLASDQKVEPELDEVAKAYIKTLEADLAYVDALLADGQIAAKYAEYAKKSIESHIEAIESGEVTADSWYGAGRMHGYGMMGRGMMRGSNAPCGY